MKKLFYLLVLAILFSTAAHAQFFEKGTSVVSAGVGIGSAIGSFTYGSQTPGISLQYEKGLWELGGPGVVSLGGYVGRKSYKYSTHAGGVDYTQKWNYTIIGIRSAYHYNGIDNEKFDVYGGLMLSYNILNYKYDGDDALHSGSYGSAAGFSAYVGGRYLFTDAIGAFAELGYGVSYLTLGMAVKL